MAEKAWYIIYTPTPGSRGELAVRSTFDRCGIPATFWTPICKTQRIRYGKLQDANGPLFPQYVFVNFEMEDQRMEQALLENGAGRFLKAPGSTVPTMVSPEEIEAVKEQEVSEAPSEHPMIIEKGAYVEITVGMIGVKGTVIDVRGNDVIIETQAFGRCTPVQINASYVTKLQGNPNEA